MASGTRLKKCSSKAIFAFFIIHKNLAALIWIDKQHSIFLNEETQRLLCSFDRITDLAYDSQPDGSIRVMIEGLRDFDKLRIEAIVNIQNPPQKK